MNRNKTALAILTAALSASTPALLLADEPDMLAAISLMPPAQPDTPAPGPSAPATPEGTPFWKWTRATGDWFGLRTALEDRGIAFTFSLTVDWSVNTVGGANTEGSTWRHLFDAGITVDTERLVGLQGGTFYVLFQQHHGDDGSEDTGDIQAYDNIDADGRTQISELWYEQRVLDGALGLRFGKMDVNGVFAAPETAGEFINSSFGFSPTIFVLPTYPDSATGLAVFVEPTDWLYVNAGLFDGALQEGIATGSRGPSSFFGDPADLFLIGEAGVRWTLRSLPGRAALGIWHHTGTFDEFDGDTTDGTTGAYGIVEQMLFAENDDADQGIGAFLQYGWADEDVSEIAHHFGGGLSWTGAIPSRDADTLGIGFSFVALSDEADFTGDDEIAYELFYAFRVTEYSSIKADVQYITDPGGDAANSDALVMTLRFQVDF